MTTVNLNNEELNMINQIVEENDLTFFSLIQQGDNGIGQTLDMKFHMQLNGRTVEAIVPITTIEDW